MRQRVSHSVSQPMVGTVSTGIEKGGLTETTTLLLAAVMTMMIMMMRGTTTKIGIKSGAMSNCVRFNCFLSK